MRNTLKKAFAALLAAALCLSFAGCYSENKTWAARKGDTTLPIGGYIYYLNNAYSEAMEKVPSGEEVIKSTIEEKDAETWIRERAENYLKAFYYVNDKFEELGLELTEEDNASIDSNTESFWSFYKSGLESIGIAKDSFQTAFTLHNTKLQKLMYAMYGKDGELELSEDDLKAYVTENYYNYQYFSAPLSTTDDEGESQDLTDEEKTDLKAKLEAYVESVNKGDMTLEEAATDYAEKELGSADKSTFSSPSPVQIDNLNESVRTGIESVKDNEAVFVETSSSYLVIYRLPIADGFADMVAEESGRNSVISAMKGTEFSDYVLEQAKSIEGLEINQTALKSIKLSTMINDDNKNGTSSASSEEDSGDDTSSTESDVSSASSDS